MIIAATTLHYYGSKTVGQSLHNTELPILCNETDTLQTDEKTDWQTDRFLYIQTRDVLSAHRPDFFCNDEEKILTSI